MVVRLLDKENDIFRAQEEGEEILGSEYPYLSLIGALMYLADSTNLDIPLAVNLLATHKCCPN